MFGDSRSDYLYWHSTGWGVRVEKDLAPWTTNLGLKGHRITALSVKRGNAYAGTDSGEIYRSASVGNSGGLLTRIWKAGSISGLKWVGSTLYATSWSGEGVSVLLTVAILGHP